MSESIGGRSLGQYALVEVIEGTDHALIYKGFQPSASRYVAVKVLKPHAARDAAVVQRFKQQGELTANMQHPNILPIYDIGEEEGTVYQVSQLVEGGSLRDHLGTYRDPRQALGLVHGIAAGLDYIHAQGTIHGNLKPGNVLLDDGQRPLLADPAFSSQSGATPTPYMSPEQVQGGAVDRRTDVYALGMVLYEMLVGQTPAPGAPISLRASRPDLPESLEQVVLKALAQNPDYRYQTPTEFGHALDGALRPAPQPVPVATPAPAPPAQPAPQPEPSGGTNWAAIILGGLLIVALVALAIAIIPRLTEEGAGEAPPVDEAPPAAEAPPVAEAPAATQPPAQVEIIVPTLEPRPTREPVELPTKPPEEEAPPVAEAPPAEPAPEEEAPPAEPPPQEEAPPAGDDGSGGLPVCNSAVLAGGFVIVGGIASFRRRRDHH